MAWLSLPVNTDQNLLAVAGARHALRFLARGGEDGQNADDDEEFDEGECARTALPLRSLNGEWHGFPFA